MPSSISEYIAQRCRSESRSDFISLDRSALGAMAMERDEFLAVMSYEISQMPNSTFSEAEMASAQAHLVDDIEAVFGRSMNYFAMLPYRAEVFFWMGLSKIPQYEEHAALSFTAQRRLREDAEELELAYNNTHATPYFMVDIWDLGLIEKLIADGVDPSLAVDVVSA